MTVVAGEVMLERKGWMPGKIPQVESVGFGSHLGVQCGGNEISRVEDVSVQLFNS